jgi:hypothetical protein
LELAGKARKEVTPPASSCQRTFRSATFAVVTWAPVLSSPSAHH